ERPLAVVGLGDDLDAWIDGEARAEGAPERLVAVADKHANRSTLAGGAGQREVGPAPQLGWGGGDWTCLHGPTIRLRPQRAQGPIWVRQGAGPAGCARMRSEEHTSELQSRFDLVCRLLLEKK